MIILDSDVLIDVADRRAPSFPFVARLQREGAVLGTTSINAGEMLRGVVPGSRAAERTARVLRALLEVPYGPRASRRYGTIMHALDRAGSSVPAVDGMIAAATLESGARLVTRNLRHMERVPGLEVLVPR